VSTRRVLITGGGGQLASDLVELLSGSDEVSARSRGELDVTDDAAVDRAFAELGPELVFNCAAFHNVEVCEHEEDRAAEVNVRAVKRLAERCAEHGSKLVHLSTNYVFDGRASEPYTEYDPPSPRSVYAFTKLGGEYAALAYAPDALVARTAGLYGLHGSASKGGNFVTRMSARAREQGALKMVADQRLSPTYTADLALALVEAVERGAAGLAHVTASGDCSWFEFTQAIMELAGIDAEVEPVQTTRAPGGADRPLNGVLARPLATAQGIPELRDWREALTDYIGRAGVAATAESEAVP
jgi:dTDP-4-dehydrorhamnose reductase